MGNKGKAGGPSSKPTRHESKPSQATLVEAVFKGLAATHADHDKLRAELEEKPYAELEAMLLASAQASIEQPSQPKPATATPSVTPEMMLAVQQTFVSETTTYDQARAMVEGLDQAILKRLYDALPQHQRRPPAIQVGSLATTVQLTQSQFIESTQDDDATPPEAQQTLAPQQHPSATPAALDHDDAPPHEPSSIRTKEQIDAIQRTASQLQPQTMHLADIKPATANLIRRHKANFTKAGIPDATVELLVTTTQAVIVNAIAMGKPNERQKAEDMQKDKQFLIILQEPERYIDGKNVINWASTIANKLTVKSEFVFVMTELAGNSYFVFVNYDPQTKKTRREPIFLCNPDAADAATNVPTAHIFHIPTEQGSTYAKQIAEAGAVKRHGAQIQERYMIADADKSKIHDLDIPTMPLAVLTHGCFKDRLVTIRIKKDQNYLGRYIQLQQFWAANKEYLDGLILWGGSIRILWKTAHSRELSNRISRSVEGEVSIYADTPLETPWNATAKTPQARRTPKDVLIDMIPTSLDNWFTPASANIVTEFCQQLNVTVHHQVHIQRITLTGPAEIIKKLHNQVLPLPNGVQVHLTAEQYLGILPAG